MTVNVGIGQNLWLAKVAASLHKPNGLDVVDPKNLEAVYSSLDLTDLPYIKRRNGIRLNLAGIYTPLDFLHAPYWVLFRQVFQSVNGHHWYLRLRGYEVDGVEYETKTAGRSYVLEHRTADPEQILALLHKGAFKVSRKLYTGNFAARGLTLGLRYRADDEQDPRSWRGRYKWKTPVSREDELYQRAKRLFEQSPSDKVVTSFDLTAYGLEPVRDEQPALFEDYHVKRGRVQRALDDINDRYGELTVVPADVKMSKNPMKDKIPFYSTKYFEITQG